MKSKKLFLELAPSWFKTMIAQIEASPLGVRLVRGAFWSLTGSIVARGLGLLSSILVARMLGTSGFGEFGIIQSTIGLFGTFAGFGLGMTATKFIAQYRTTNPEKAGRIRALSSSFAWVTSVITALAFFFMSPWLAGHTLAAPHLTDLFRIGSLILLLTAVNGAQIGALAGFEAFRTIAKISFWSGLANFPLMVGGVWLLGLTGAAWGMVVATALNWFLNHMAIRKECVLLNIPYTYKGCWAEQETLWKFSLPAMISGIFFAPTEWVLSAILVNQPDGYDQMGLFNAAKQWHVLILYLPNTLSSLTLPILSNLFGEGNRQKFTKMVVINSLGLTGLALIISLPVAYFSETIMRAYGVGFVDGQNVLLLVCAYSTLWAANIVVGQVLWSTGSSGLAMILAAVRSAILLGCFTYFMPQNALGLALTFTITYALQTVYQGVLSVKSIDKVFCVASEIANMEPSQPSVGVCHLVEKEKPYLGDRR